MCRLFTAHGAEVRVTMRPPSRSYNNPKVARDSSHDLRVRDVMVAASSPTRTSPQRSWSTARSSPAPSNATPCRPTGATTCPPATSRATTSTASTQAHRGPPRWPAWTPPASTASSCSTATDAACAACSASPATEAASARAFRTGPPPLLDQQPSTPRDGPSASAWTARQPTRRSCPWLLVADVRKAFDLHSVPTKVHREISDARGAGLDRARPAFWDQQRLSTW
jgi:hypothetical protein